MRRRKNQFAAVILVFNAIIMNIICRAFQIAPLKQIKSCYHYNYNCGIRHVILKRYVASSSASRQEYDVEQARLMNEEQVISVTFDDKPIKPVSKRDSHLNKLGPILHRAFSVFLFDTQGRLLLQKRASSKITFPDYWTNTCCSHPLWTEFEMGADVKDPVIGCKRAAIRKLEHELGIPAAQIDLNDLDYLTRIHYIAEDSDEWGEHEVDYIFTIQKDVPLQLNLNEVSEVKYVDEATLKGMVRQAEIYRGSAMPHRDSDEEEKVIKFTPWSRAIMERFLHSWWTDVLPQGSGDLSRHYDVSRIHRIGRVDPY